MKLRVLYAAPIAVALVVGCSRNERQDQSAPAYNPPAANQPVTGQNERAMPGTDQAARDWDKTQQQKDTTANAAPTVSNDAEVAKVLDIANQGEIDQAKLAQKTAVNANVKKFADMMVADHQKAIDDQKALLKKIDVSPKDNELAKSFKDEGKQQLDAMKDKKGAEFDRLYMDTQVKAHQKLLDTIDKDLLPRVSNAEFKAQVKTVRDTVNKHLTEAKDIQASKMHAMR